MDRCNSNQGRSGTPNGERCKNAVTHTVTARFRFNTLSLCQQCAAIYQRYPKEFTVKKITNKD